MFQENPTIQLDSTKHLLKLSAQHFKMVNNIILITVNYFFNFYAYEVCHRCEQGYKQTFFVASFR